MTGNTLKERIKDHFNSKDWDYRFEWGKNNEKWGAKYETIISLSRILNCPKTSLYIPVKELHNEKFLNFSHKLISTESKLSDGENIKIEEKDREIAELKRQLEKYETDRYDKDDFDGQETTHSDNL